MALNESAMIEVSDEVVFDVINHISLVTLNRPKALNALSHRMVVALLEHRCIAISL